MILQLSSRLVADTTAALSLALAAFIAYQAFRGYRRNDSRPMLFLSVGFVLMLVVPIGGAFLTREVLTASQYVASRTEILLAQRASTLTGLVCVVYSLYDS